MIHFGRRKWELTGLVLSPRYDVAQSWGTAHIVDGPDLDVICRIGENECDLRLSGLDLLPRGLSWHFTDGHIVAAVQLFGRKLAQKGDFITN